MHAPVVVTYGTWRRVTQALIADSAEAQYFRKRFEELQDEYTELLGVREYEYARWRSEQLYAIPQTYILGAGPLEHGIRRAREMEESELFSDPQGERPPQA